VPAQTLPRPEAMTHRSVTWTVLSQQEQAVALRQLKQQGAFICVTPQGYENLSRNMSEIERWSAQMDDLVSAYEDRVSKPADPP